jgi:hypothetical protein
MGETNEIKAWDGDGHVEEWEETFSDSTWSLNSVTDGPG